MSNTEAHQSYELLFEAFNLVPLQKIGPHSFASDQCQRADTLVRGEDIADEATASGEATAGSDGAAGESVRAKTVAAGSYVRQVASDWALAIEKARAKYCSNSTKQRGFSSHVRKSAEETWWEN